MIIIFSSESLNSIERTAPAIDDCLRSYVREIRLYLEKYKRNFRKEKQKKKRDND